MSEISTQRTERHTYASRRVRWLGGISAAAVAGGMVAGCANPADFQPQHVAATIDCRVAEGKVYSPLGVHVVGGDETRMWGVTISAVMGPMLNEKNPGDNGALHTETIWAAEQFVQGKPNETTYAAGYGPLPGTQDAGTPSPRSTEVVLGKEIPVTDWTKAKFISQLPNTSLVITPPSEAAVHAYIDTAPTVLESDTLIGACSNATRDDQFAVVHVPAQKTIEEGQAAQIGENSVLAEAGLPSPISGQVLTLG
ncbi:MAG TPA: hypothetical protein VIM53_02440 [Candidatus Saccharimonadales bacterium]